MQLFIYSLGFIIVSSETYCENSTLRKPQIDSLFLGGLHGASVSYYYKVKVCVNTFFSLLLWKPNIADTCVFSHVTTIQ